MKLIQLSVLLLAANAKRLSVRDDDFKSKIEELKDVKDPTTIPKNLPLENPDAIKHEISPDDKDEKDKKKEAEENKQMEVNSVKKEDMEPVPEKEK